MVCLRYDYRLTKATFTDLTDEQSLIPSYLLIGLSFSPPSMIVPYTEAIFSTFAFMLPRLLIEKKVIKSFIIAFLATSTRANGVFLSGYYVYYLLLYPVLKHNKLPSNIIYVSVFFIPIKATKANKIIEDNFNIIRFNGIILTIYPDTIWSLSSSLSGWSMVSKFFAVNIQPCSI